MLLNIKNKLAQSWHFFVGCWCGLCRFTCQARRRQRGLDRTLTRTRMHTPHIARDPGPQGGCTGAWTRGSEIDPSGNKASSYLERARTVGLPDVGSLSLGDVFKACQQPLSLPHVPSLASGICRLLSPCYPESCYFSCWMSKSLLPVCWRPASLTPILF